MMFTCCVIFFILKVLELCNAQNQDVKIRQEEYSQGLTYRELIEEQGPQCKTCTANWTTTPVFCNIVAAPSNNYTTFTGIIFNEINKTEDLCYCEKIGSIFYAKDPILPACTRIPNICETLSKDEVCKKAGRTCEGGQWSTFHCSCAEGWQGQLCNVPHSAGQVVKNPILVHYLHAFLVLRQFTSVPPLLPGLYFITESLGDDFRLIVAFEDGRKIQVQPSYFTRKNYREECLTDIREKIHFISEHHCNLIPEGNVYGYGIFLDKMMRTNLHASDNLFPTNHVYANTMRSAGRFAKLDIQVRNKDKVTWKWDTFQVFVPYQRFFIQCSSYLQLLGCGEEEAPIEKSIEEPMIFKATRQKWPWSWFRSDCHDRLFKVDDHRWYIEDITDPEKLDDWIPAPKLPEKYSLGVDGSTKIIPKGELGEGKYLVIYDLIQDLFAKPKWDTVFVQRKLCYFDVVSSKALKVYLHTRDRSVSCNKPFNIDVKNYNPIHYDNERLTITWTCEGSSTPECGVKQTKGIEPYTNVLKCGVKYKFTAKATHPKSKKSQAYEISINSEDRGAAVDIECIKSCGYKVNPDQFLYLRATENPPISTSWKWEIREVTLSDSGKEMLGGEDLVGSLRQANTEANICIVPPNKLTPGKEYRVYARTPAAYSSYSFMVNKPPMRTPKVGTCNIEPTSGVTLVTKFRIECEGWKDDDKPMTYRVYEVPDPTGPEVEPLERSEYAVIENLKLRRNNIMVIIGDSLGLYSQHNFTVTLTKFTKRNDEEYVKKTIENINEKLEGNGEESALTDIDYLTKEIEEQNLQISEKTALELLKTHSEINTFDEPFYLEKALNVHNRIMKLKILEPKERTDELLLEGSEQLKRYTEAAEDLAHNDKLDLPFDKEILTSFISEASCTILLKKDPVIEEDIAPEDIHEEHVQRVNIAKDNALKSMEKLVRVLTKSVEYQEQKYATRKGCFDISTKNGNASQLRDELNKIELPSKYYKNESANIGLIAGADDISLGSPNEIGLVGVVTKFSNTAPEKKGPVDISMRVPNYHNRNVTIEGEYKPIPVCPSDSKLDKSFDVHNIQLPDGDGVVVLNFAQDLVGKVKLFAKQGNKPNRANTTTSPTLNSSDAYIKFSNRDHATDSDFYVAMLGAGEESKKKEYKFTCRILRCSVYNGGKFVSRGCTFQNLTFHDPGEDPTVHCRCNLSSDASSSTTWLSVNMFVPKHHIALSNDVYLFSMVVDNSYAASLVSFFFLALIVILLWGYRLDSQDERTRTVILMEDNYPGDDHAYVIAVFTGQGIGSGTSSRVAIRIFGEQGYSRVHLLHHSQRRTLQSGHDDWFLVTAAIRLGRITRIQMWHNHSGRSAEWYCKKISVFDLEDHVKYDFIIERWFTFDIRVPLDEARMYEGRVATDAEVSKTWYLLVGGWVFSEMREKHHLASIFRRHPRSLYTRCQRVIISFTFIMCTMLVSMMFFKVDEVGPADWPVIPFKLNDIWTGIKSSIISTLITLAVVICFGQHKKYETASLKKEPKFEVIDASEQSGKRQTAAAKKDNVPPASGEPVWLKFIKPTPVEYKPVVYGVKQQKTSKLSLMYLYTGWIFAFVTITVMSFFVVMYGLRFGPKKTMVWALTFVTGTFSDGIIFGPLRIALLGMVVARTFKKSYLDSYTMQIQIDTSKLAYRRYMDRLKWNYQMRLKVYYKPCYTVQLERYRSKKLKGREFTYLLTHSAMIILMLAIVILLATLIGVREGYYHIRQLTELFTGGKSDQDANRVWNKRSMYTFFSKTAVPAVHRIRWYNNRTLQVERNERKSDPNSPRYRSQVKGFVKDYTNKLMGVPRLRQLRLSNSSYNNKKVPKMFQHYWSNGLGHYYWYGEDKNNYLPPWVPYNGYHGFLEQVWAYYTPTHTDTGKTTGYSLIQYGGGGHVMPLSWNLGYSLRRMKFLEMNDWMTNRTRCIFLEINVYNNNMKHFSVMRFIVEALPSGPYWNRPQMDVVMLHLAGRPKAQAAILLVTILLIMLISYSVLCVWHSSRNGLLAYLSTWRGLSDMVLISVGFLTVSSQYNRALHFSLITEYLDEQPRDTHTSLFSPLTTKRRANEVFCTFILILMFNMSCTLFKFKMYSGMNRVLSTVWKLAIAICIIVNSYGILLISIQSITQGTELWKLFILQFTFKDEIFHQFTQESRIFYVLFIPLIYALFKFHVGYLIYSQSTYSQEWKLPTFFTFARYKLKKPKRLPRRRRPTQTAQPTQRPLGSRAPGSQMRRKIQKTDDAFQLIK